MGTEAFSFRSGVNRGEVCLIETEDVMSVPYYRTISGSPYSPVCKLLSHS